MCAQSEGSLAIRRALPSEAGSLTQVALRSKAHWGYDDGFMARVAHMLTISEGYVAQWPMFVAQLDDEVVGFYGLRDTEGTLYLTDLWVLPQHIGFGLGRQLWNHAVDQVRRLKREAFLIAADPNAEPFYLRMGARRVGETDGGAGRMIPLMRFDLSDR